jgi:nucleoside-diphosphate-sugar epimerase
MKIGICGAGWLGLPLALHLQRKKHTVVATKRKTEAVEKLLSQNLNCVQYTLGDELASDRLACLFASEVICLNIAAGRRSLDPEMFEDKMCKFISYAKNAGVQHLIFISTSSVYGESTRIVYEYSSLNPITDSAKAHVIIEKYVNNTFKDCGCILRLGGLVGEDRHPAKSLAGKKALSNGQRKVNLVHQLDVIAAITAIIEKQCYGQTFHLSAEDHPTRQTYYQTVAELMALDPPEFLPSDDINNVGKQLNCELTMEKLGLELSYPSPLDMLD